MKISSDMVEYVRTMVQGDHEANSRFEAKIDEAGWDNFPKLLGAVFFFAVDHQFGGEATSADVMRFVAEMRAAAQVEPAVIDANAAEDLIHSALDPAITNDVEPEMAGRIQALTIMHILGSADFSEQDLDDLLEEAVQLVDRL
jgi:hypothetical protein